MLSSVAELVVIGFVAGVIAGISPCILPVLPVVLVAGAGPGDGRRPRRSTWARPVAVVAGLIVSFSFLILAGSEVLSLLHLPQDFLRDAGIALLVAVGLGFLIPPLGDLLERPFARLSGRQPTGTATGFVVGLASGLVFAPCAGPILATITVVGATHRVGLTAVFLTAAFAAGAAIPLLAVALAGSEVARRTWLLRRQAVRLRAVSGVVLIAMALAIGFNTFAGLQRDVPGYTSALQNKVEGSQKVRKQLGHLTGSGTSSLADCNSMATVLINCGPAPNFAGVTAWLNTPGGRALSISGLRGKVVLVDFWTYSCINCQRALPHVEAWYRRYAPYGFVVVGVHTPEFSFEHVISNVRSAAASLGVKYPIAVDNDYDTWNAYDNEYWPADYLIDASGDVRHVSFGEGGYAETESLIRQLLTAAHPGLVLPPPTDVPDKTPTEATSPETYVGYGRLQYLAPGESVTPDRPFDYQAPPVELAELAFSGTWTVHSQEATADSHASSLALGFEAEDVYLVMGGTGTVGVTVNGKALPGVILNGYPKLYHLFHSPVDTQGLMVLTFSPGIQAYDFTFG
jgi:cytochrome c biogenesis protein CcdA/thiol-disulfide isomerase/thioredoxin